MDKNLNYIVSDEHTDKNETQRLDAYAGKLRELAEKRKDGEKK